MQESDTAQHSISAAVVTVLCFASHADFLDLLLSKARVRRGELRVHSGTCMAQALTPCESDGLSIEPS